jgi:4-diphosphocytidyl-2-C-methyl-D-erythritol kinase
MKLRAFAKVNLGLEIEGKMDDGYHRIKTIFQSIDLFDILDFEIMESGIEVKGDREDIPWNEGNLIYKAVKKFNEKFGIKKGVRVYVEKRIPPGSGLGGGSSNAACTLIALRRIFCPHLEMEKLVPIASEIGADVPYFLHGGTCLGEGRGDLIREIEDLENLHFFIVIPDVNVSSEEAYNEWDRSRLTFSPKKSNIKRLEKHIDLDSLRNDLEKVVFRKYKKLEEIKKRMKKEGFRKVLMSGSGSSIFGVIDDMNKIEELRDKFSLYRVEIVRSIGRKEYWKRLFID